MKELVIDVTGVKNEILELFKQNVMLIFQDKSGVFTNLELEKNKYLLLAFKRQDEEKIKKLIEEFVCSVVREQFKKDFIYSNLDYKNKAANKFKLLVNVLSCFDREFDDKKIKEKLSYEGYLCILSFYYFKLSFLEHKWGEIIKLTNVNSECFLFNEHYFDFVRFIISSLEYQTEKLSVFKRKEGYCISSNKTRLATIKSEDEFEIVSSLIKYNPRKINVGLLNKNVLELVVKLFDKRVEIVQY